MDGDLTQPYGLSRNLLPGPLTPTEPLPVIEPQLEPLDAPASVLVAVKAQETCGPCGSSLAVEWVGRTDTLTVIREWRMSHRCEPPAPDGAGMKAAHVERIGFMP